MSEHAERTRQNTGRSQDKKAPRVPGGGEPTHQLVDNRREAVAQRMLQGIADGSPRTSRPRTIQRTINAVDQAKISNLVELNAALAQLKPPVPALTLPLMNVPHATAVMLDEVIEADKNYLYDELTQPEVIDYYTVPLQTKVNAHLTRPLNFLYQDHGNKHFFGGPKGTKFIGAKGTINAAFETLIQNHSREIRTAATNKFDLILPTDGTCPAKDDNRRPVRCIKIQLAYDADADRVEYHGYPYHVDEPLGLKHV